MSESTYRTTSVTITTSPMLIFTFYLVPNLENRHWLTYYSQMFNYVEVDFTEILVTLKLNKRVY